jgi:hypothetical protein
MLNDQIIGLRTQLQNKVASVDEKYITSFNSLPFDRQSALLNQPNLDSNVKKILLERREAFES